MKKVTGAPIKFLGVGEKIDEFEVFHPDRLASESSMRDAVSLVEKAQENLDQEDPCGWLKRCSRPNSTLRIFSRR